MDADRFDSLTRSLTAQVTRRRGLGLLGALGLGASIGAWDADAKKKKGKGRKKKKARPACQIEQGAAATTTILTVSHKGLSLTTVDRVPLNPKQAHTSTTTVRQKRSLVLQTTLTYGVGIPTRLQTSYGNAFKGTREADFTTNRTTVSGNVDGRAIVPFAAETVPETLQFQDGQPGPEMSVSAALAGQLTRLYAQAEAKAEACASAQDRARRSDVTAESPFSVGCLACKGTCMSTESGCLKGAGGLCLAFLGFIFLGPSLYAACSVAKFAVCAKIALDCLDICREARVCCPVACGDWPDWTCCTEGQTCLVGGDIGTFRCCQAGQFPCHGQNCCPSSQRCMPNGTCCIAPDFPCGQTCCDRTLSCCNGVCCRGQCLGGVCCTPPSRRCGSGFFAKCCANECCNTVCCAAGEACHPTTGQCAVLCPSGQDFCPTGGNGRCCNPLQDCCGSSTGGFFCGPQGCVA